MVKELADYWKKQKLVGKPAWRPDCSFAAMDGRVLLFGGASLDNTAYRLTDDVFTLLSDEQAEAEDAYDYTDSSAQLSVLEKTPKGWAVTDQSATGSVIPRQGGALAKTARPGMYLLLGGDCMGEHSEDLLWRPLMDLELLDAFSFSWRELRSFRQEGLPCLSNQQVIFLPWSGRLLAFPLFASVDDVENSAASFPLNPSGEIGEQGQWAVSRFDTSQDPGRWGEFEVVPLQGAPVSIRGSYTPVLIGRYIYLYGGLELGRFGKKSRWDRRVSSTFYRIDAETLEATELPMPEWPAPRYDYAATALSDRYLLLCGGKEQLKPPLEMGESFLFDTQTDTWIELWGTGLPKGSRLLWASEETLLAIYPEGKKLGLSVFALEEFLRDLQGGAFSVSQAEPQQREESEAHKENNEGTSIYDNENVKRPIEELELSVRTANGLMNADLVYIGELVQKTEAELLKIKGFGLKSLKEIKEILAEMGLCLGMKLRDWPGREALS